jgi:GR25 family glycosyltransferase involved in LPS biosynthesis
MVKAHVINLAERTDRWASFQQEWKDSGLELVREDAIKVGGAGSEVENVYHAVFLKHRQILQEALDRGEEHCLIMEDDALPRADFVSRFQHMRDYLDIRNDWDVFNGGLLSIRDKINTITRIDDFVIGNDKRRITTLLLNITRGCMAQFVYFKVAPALKRMEDWEAEGKPEFDGWYPNYLRCFACIPYLASQKDGHSDATNNVRKWEQRFDDEEISMRYSLKDFLETQQPSEVATEPSIREACSCCDPPSSSQHTSHSSPQ